MDAETRGLDELQSYLAAQGHIAGRRELLARGFPASRVRSWVRQGRLIPVLHGVYSFGRDIETPEAAYRAATVVAGEGAVLAGRSACEAWEVVQRRETIPRSIEVIRAGKPLTFRGSSTALRQTQVRVLGRDLEPSEVRERYGLRLTNPVRSLIDFSVDATETQLKFAFLEACRLRLLGRPDVTYCYRRIEGRRGAAKLRPLLSGWVPELNRIKSVLEGMFWLDWADTGLVKPEVNVRIHGFEVDFFWRAQGVALETDGEAYHSDPLSRRRDAFKARHLESQGIVVLRATYREIRDTPQEVIRRVARELAKR